MHLQNLSLKNKKIKKCLHKGLCCVSAVTVLDHLPGM